jgi:hypothetical protein
MGTFKDPGRYEAVNPKQFPIMQVNADGMPSQRTTDLGPYGKSRNEYGDGYPTRGGENICT